jgi:hypothetical protein
MERTAWTDERLDDLARRMAAGFERVDADIRELRLEVRGMGAELRGEIGALRVTVFRLGVVLIAAMMSGFFGMIAALLARGG